MLEIVAFAVGCFIVAYVVQSAVRTVVLPRVSRTSLSNAVFNGTAAALKAIASRRKQYEDEDAILAAIGPTGLMLIPAAWLTLVLLGFACMFWATDPDMGIGGAFNLAGSSITTLGFADAVGAGQRSLAFSAAFLGLLLLTLLITYLPSIYSGFQRREQKVELLEVRAGTPPSAEVMIARFQAIGWLDELATEWTTWEAWFAELEESHTSHASLPWFRSTVPTRSWLTAAGTVLDAASLWTSAIAGLSPSDHASAALTIRAGFISLRRIAEANGVPFDADPAPSDPITIQRSEFDTVVDRLEGAGVPVVSDRDLAWVAFAGWRVNYDSALLGLAQMLRVPYAPWTSDRYPIASHRKGERNRHP
jgi:hypothetical protein